MYCIHCGKQIPDESSFCEHCGGKISDDAGQDVKQQPKEEEQSSGKQTYWDKFAEIYDSRGEEKDKYNALVSDAAWEILSRFSTNAFVAFMEQTPTLNKKPNKDVETLKNEFTLSVIAGYYMWLAEQIYNHRDLKLPAINNVEDLAKGWKEANMFEDSQRYMENIPTMVTNAMDTFLSWRAKSVLEEATSLNDLPHELIEGIKTNLGIIIVMGYALGSIEDKYRK